GPGPRAGGLCPQPNVLVVADDLEQVIDGAVEQQHKGGHRRRRGWPPGPQLVDRGRGQPGGPPDTTASRFDIPVNRSSEQNPIRSKSVRRHVIPHMISWAFLGVSTGLPGVTRY